MQDIIQQLAAELNKDPRHVENVVRLLDEGNTIPFIARYRKELHGAMELLAVAGDEGDGVALVQKADHVFHVAGILVQFSCQLLDDVLHGA